MIKNIESEDGREALMLKSVTGFVNFPSISELNGLANEMKLLKNSGNISPELRLRNQKLYEKWEKERVTCMGELFGWYVLHDLTENKAFKFFISKYGGEDKLFGEWEDYIARQADKGESYCEIKKRLLKIKPN